MKLYQLADQYKHLMQLIEASLENEEADEDDTQMLTDTLDSINDMLEIKVENIAKLLKSFEGEIELYKAEESRLNKHRKRLENKHEWLKEYLRITLVNSEIDKVKAGIFNVALQKNPPAVFIHNEKIIPKEFREKQPDKIKSAEILKALKDGIEVIGASFAPEKKHLRIR